MKARLLFVNHTLDFRAGGAEVVLRDLMEGLDRERFHVELAVPTQPSEFLTPFSEITDRVEILPSGEFGETGRRGRSLQVGASLLRLILVFAIRLRRLRPDLIYVNSIFALHFALLPARCLGIPVVYHEHSLVSQRRDSLWHIAFPFLVRRATLVIAIAEAVREELLALGLEPGLVVTIHNGIRCDRDSSPPDQPLPTSLAAGGFIVGQVANLHSWKGQDTLIRALGILRADVPEARVVLLGGSPNPVYRDELLTLTRELGVEDVVEFAGFRADADRLLPRFSCIVVASKAEPFGLALLEAMRAGVPVVGAAAGGVVEIVRDGENGLHFPPGDAAALADHLHRLATDPALREQLIDRGHRTVLEDFSVASQLTSVEAALMGLLPQSN